MADYAKCPQRYAYKWLHQVSEPVHSEHQTLLRAIHRAQMRLVRQKLDGITPTYGRAEEVWRLHSRKLGFVTSPRWNMKGREAVLAFYTWLGDVEPYAIGTPITMTVQVQPKWALEITTHCDFQAKGSFGDGAFLLRPPELGLLSGLLNTTTDIVLPWYVYDTFGGTVKPLATNMPAREHYAVLWNLYRGMSRRIIWSQRDERCTECPFSDVCEPRDSGYAHLADLRKPEIEKRRRAKHV